MNATPPSRALRASRTRCSHAERDCISFPFCIWTPKYRRKVLVGPVESRLKELLREKAQAIGVTIEQMEGMPDHLHPFVKCQPPDSAHYIVQQFKGYTSRILRQEFSTLKSQMPSLWARSYYVESVEHLSEDTIRRYIEDQKK